MTQPQVKVPLTVRVYGDTNEQWQAIAAALGELGYNPRREETTQVPANPQARKEYVRALGGCDVVLFLGWSKEGGVPFLGDVIEEHGAWNYLGTVVVGEPAVERRRERLHQIGPSRYLTANAPAESVAKAIAHTFEASQWACERRGTLPAFVVNTADGRIVRANEAAGRLFDDDHLVGKQYMRAVERADSPNFTDHHPIRRAVRSGTPLVESRTWRKGDAGDFSCFLLCHPVTTPQTPATANPKGDEKAAAAETNGDAKPATDRAKADAQNVSSALVWVVDRTGAAAVDQAFEDLFQPKDETDLYRRLVQTACRLGFSGARLYRYHHKHRAYYGLEVWGGEDDVDRVQFLRWREGEPVGGCKWSVAVGEDYDPVSSFIYKQHTPFLFVPNSVVERIGEMRYEFQGPAKETPGVTKDVNERWIEVPLWVAGPDGGMPTTPWGKLSLSREHWDSLTDYDLRDVQVYGRLAASAIAAHERAAELRGSLDRIEKCTPMIAECLRNEFTQLFIDYPEIESAVIPPNAPADAPPPEMFDVVIAKVLHVYLEATGGGLALYRQQTLEHDRKLQQIGPILRRGSFAADTVAPPSEWQLDPRIPGCFDFFHADPKAEPYRVKNPAEVFQTYQRAHGPSATPAEGYLGLIADELQIPVFEGNRVCGAVVVVSDTPNAFANPPPLVYHLVRVVSIWLDLARRAAGRTWADITTDRLVRLLHRLDAVSPDDDTAWFAGLSCLLSDRAGLQWNRVFVWDSAATARPFTARLVYALGGLCANDGSTEEHRTLQRALPVNDSVAALDELLLQRISRPQPHLTDEAGTVTHRDALYDLFWGEGQPPEEVSYPEHMPPAGGQDDPLAHLLHSVLTAGTAAELSRTQIELGVDGGRWVNELRARFPAIFRVPGPATTPPDRRPRLHAFPLVSPLGPDRQPLGAVVVEMLMPNRHQEENRIQATQVFLRLASDLLAMRRLRRRQAGWLRNAPVVYHERDNSLNVLRQQVAAFYDVLYRPLWEELGVTPDPAARAEVARRWADKAANDPLFPRFAELYDNSARELNIRIHNLSGWGVNISDGCTPAQFAAALRTDFYSPLARDLPFDVVFPRLDGIPEVALPVTLDVLRLVASNLVQNTIAAYRRVARGGPINCEFWFSLPARQPDTNSRFARFIELNYEDDGPGVEPEERAFVFLKGYSSADGADRGQGLAMVKAMLLDSQADIRVEDPCRRRGAHFVILFGVPKPT